MKRIGVVVTALLLGACAGIPTTGSVKTGPALAPIDGSGVIRVIARPPAPGLEPAQIVQGFLAASASLSDLSVAEQYLTPVAAQEWNPRGVTVIRGAIQVAVGPSDTVVVSGALDGTVDATDHWQVAQQGEQFSQTWGLEKIDDEWRISSLSNGVVVTRTAAERALRSYDVLFLDPTFSSLVPDPITVATSSAGLATTLIRRLLAGPSEWLAPAVTTAIPDGTRLAFESVPILNGVAQVQLTEEVLAANSRERAALSAQIVRTLAPVPGVASVAITVGGAPLAGPNIQIVQSIASWSEYGPDVIDTAGDAFALMDGQPSLLNTATGASDSGGTSVAPLLELDIARDGRTWAGVTQRRDALVVGIRNQPGAVVLEGANLASPQMVAESAWVVQRGIGINSVSNGQPMPVPASDILGQSLDASVLSIRIARDRTRAALIARQNGRSRLFLARVETSGATTRLVGAKRIENTMGDVLDVAWQGASRLVLLEATGAANPRMVTLSLGLSTPQFTDVPSGAIRIAAAPGKAVLLGVPSDVNSSLYIRSSGRWTALATGTEPVYP